jgi:hypothetical protein
MTGVMFTLVPVNGDSLLGFVVASVSARALSALVRVAVGADREGGQAGADPRVLHGPFLSAGR